MAFSFARMDSLRRWVLLLTIALSACGGGGGGSTTASSTGSSGSGTTTGVPTTPPPATDNSWLTFSQPEVALVAQAGSPTSFSIIATSSKTIAERINVVVVDNGGIVVPESTFISKLSTTSYQASFAVSPALRPGTYTSSLTVMLCLDASPSCEQPYPGSPWSVPYTLVVAANAWGAQAATPLSFSYVEGGSDTHRVPLMVTGPGKNWSLTSKPSWLDLSAASGISPSTVYATARAGSARGAYTGSVVFTASTGESVSLPASLNVTGLGVTAGAAGGLNLSVVNGTKAFQTVSVKVGAGSTKRWTARSATPWLGVATAGGTSPLTLDIALDPSIGTLASGQHAGRIDFTASDGSAVSLPVNMDLKAPTISASTDVLLIGGATGKNLGATSVDFALNTGVNPFPWKLESFPTWLMTPSSINLGSQVTTTVSVTPIVSQLIGAGTSQIVVSAQVNGDKVSKTLPVAPRLDQQKLLFSETGLLLSQLGPLSSLNRTLKVKHNFGLSTAWTATSDSPWLRVTSSGSTNSSGVSDFVVSADVGGQPLNSYLQATVTLRPTDPAVQAPEKLVVGLWYGTAAPTGKITQLSESYAFALADPVRPYVYVHTQGSIIDVYNLYTGDLVTRYQAVATRASTMTIAHNGSALYVLDYGPDSGTAANPNRLASITTINLKTGGQTRMQLDSTASPYEGFAYARPNGVGVLILANTKTVIPTDTMKMSKPVFSRQVVTPGVSEPTGGIVVARDSSKAVIIGTAYSYGGMQATSPSLYSLDYAFGDLQTQLLWPASATRQGLYLARSAAFSSDNTRFYTLPSVQAATNILTWDGTTGAQLVSTPPTQFTNGVTRFVHMASDGRFYYGADPYVAVIPVGGSVATQWITLASGVTFLTSENSFVTSADGRMAFAALLGGKIQFLPLN